MRICIVGSLLPIDVYDRVVKNSKSKPSNAPENFQMMLAEGIYNSCKDLDLLSIVNVASYPNGSQMTFHSCEYDLPFGAKVKQLKMINIQGIKQKHIYLETYRALQKWACNNCDEDKFVIMYSDYPPQADACRKICKKYDIKCVLLMTDLPTYYMFKHKPSLYSYFMKRMDKKRKENFAKFDAYILLTQWMSGEMKIDSKPQIVIEGFANPNQYNFSEVKEAIPTVMYSGALSQVHNIKLLVNAFKKTDINAKLWLFGSGDLEEWVKSEIKDDNRISYFGKVSREELLHRQKRAHLLISVKSVNDEHTKYAFPSKVLEYMSSGTPVLSTKALGIPEEYFNYMYTLEDESENAVAKKIEQCLCKTQKELDEMGERALDFVSRNKHFTPQGKKIVDFIEGLRWVE